MTEHAGFDWDDRYLLGYNAMDDTHREFVSLVNALLTVDDAQLPAALDAFAAHAEDHFAQENSWMETDGFPARDCHVDEHDKVLASVREVQQLLAEGNVEVVRELAVALMEWFPGHADYMDSALALWMVKRSHGGAPLVFRRETAKSR
ncbi:hemerythrin domain-containing protein [Thauera sp.]|uniref:bacteriohemerythrin n=1 Tax=Thauera sp. TaxID=1905334 RepID=UPI002BF0B7A8|nr:hemerythrin domain-containing protein [Thauera sp.]HRP22578.1 hemerythrin domain-containing protein [Thauera sp.]